MSKWPNGQLKNETDSEAGTPVVREILGDPLTNIYAILTAAGITPNGQEDSETNGYQFLEALQKLANVLNDVEQILTLTGTVWSVNMDLDNLPDKYVFIARVTEDYNDAVGYTIEGTGSNSYALTSATGFKAAETVLVVLDHSGVRVLSLTASATTSEDVFTVFGTPVSFNSSSKMYYEENGSLLTDTPTINHLQNIIRVAESNGTLLVYNMFIMQGHALCFCYLPDVQTYKFYQFDLNDLDTAELVTVEEIVIPTGSNNEPYAYTDGTMVYLTNLAGTTTNDYELAGLTYDPNAKTLNNDITRILDTGFTKTTNAVIQPNELVTFVAGALKKYNLSTGAETYLADYNTFMGAIFRFNGNTYYSNGEVAKKWTV
ncbi:hypothetical protein C7967_11549 [Thalassospira sp. 11-3]|nr:hypothetical protein C7967_11549 [Thalassospira sp. 11-3]